MSVGPSPLVNAEMPSVRHTFRTQSSVEEYFWPVEGVNPSVCILDLTMSMGYMTAHNYGRNHWFTAYEDSAFEKRLTA